MRKNLIRGFLSAFLLLSASVHAGISYNANHGDIEDMLYCRRIPDELLAWSKDEIRQLKEMGNFIQWRDRAGRTRKTLEFGFSFKEVEKNNKSTRYEIPPFLREIRRQVVELFQDQLHENDPERYENCIVTFYFAGDGIKPHTDREYFGPDILGLIITPDDSADPSQQPSNLYFTKGTQSPIFIPEEEGMAYLITGELRTLWEHQLDPVVSERISIQFRTVDEHILDSYLDGSR